MNYLDQLLTIRYNMEKEIIHKVVSNAINSERTIEFNRPQEFPIQDESGYPVKMIIQGIDCNTGKPYDVNNNVVDYRQIPVEILCEMYDIVVSKEFIFKPIMFI